MDTIKEGIKGYAEHIVTKEDTAARYGSGLLEVFATPALVALMENTALKSIEKYLPEGFSTVGTEINVKHLKATLIGKKIICESELIKAGEKKLCFSLSARDEEGLTGTGTHTRYIVNSARFMEKLEK
jgi:predicted thioesterase